MADARDECVELREAETDRERPSATARCVLLFGRVDKAPAPGAPGATHGGGNPFSFPFLPPSS